VTQPTFEWDPRKAEENLAKHGVPFEEAVMVFMDPLARIHDDPDHSRLEAREIMVGTSDKKRLLMVSYTENADRIRLISAREATKQEREDYEEAQ
jgi:uncharacterized DUF497 family protein